jgi:hypothetical protein
MMSLLLPEIPELLGVKSQYAAPERAEDISVEEIDRLFDESERLRKELLELAAQLRTDVRLGIRTLYCLDFSVIRSAIDWDRSIDSAELWSGICVQLGTQDLILLPGALFEAIRYLRTRAALSSVVNTNPFFEVFERASLDESFSHKYLKQQYPGAVQDFSAINLFRDDLYIIDIFQRHLASPHEHTMPGMDRSMFHRGIDILSFGSRADRWMNNRADSVNYALCHSLNQGIDKTKTRYLFVSDAPSMRKLDRGLYATHALGRATRHFNSEGLVRPTRSAAIHQILLRRATDQTPPDTLALNLVDDLANYQSKLSSMRRQHHGTRPRPAAAMSERTKANAALTPSDLSIDSHLIHLISKLDFMQNIMKGTDATGIASFVGRRADKITVRQFYDQIDKMLSTALEETSYSSVFAQHDTETHKLKLVELDKGPGLYIREHGLSDEAGLNVAYIREFSDMVTAYTFNASVPLAEFLAAVNYLKADVIGRMAKGEILDPKPFQTDTVYVGVKGAAVSSFECASHADYDLVAIADTLGVIASDIIFIRIDNNLVSMSFEGDLLAISTAYKLHQQMEDFLATLIPAERKVYSPQVALKKFFQDTRFTFLIP